MIAVLEEARKKMKSFSEADEKSMKSDIADSKADFKNVVTEVKAEGISPHGTSQIDVAGPAPRGIKSMTSMPGAPLPAAVAPSAGVISTADPATMSFAPTGTPSPDMAVDMLGPEVNQIVTAIQPLEEVFKQLGLEASQFDTSLDELNVAAAQAHTSVDMAGDGFVNANAQVQSAAFQTDTTLVDLANGASQAANESKQLAQETKQAVQAQDDQVKANKDAIDQNKETTKAGFGSMGMFMALQSALAMLPSDIN